MPEKPKTWTRESILAYKKAYETERRKKLGTDKKSIKFSIEEIDKFTQGLTGMPARKGAK